MRKSILFLASAALLFAGCAKVEDEAPIPEEGKRVVTLKASIDEDDTRVSVETDRTYKWQSGDEIGVWVVNTYGGAPYSYTTEDSGTTANFEVSLDEGESIGEYAFYPFSENHFVSGEGPRFALDANLQYIEDATNMPMLGTVSNGAISFKSVGSVIKLTVNNIPSDAAHLLFSAKDLNGDNLFISGVFPVSGDQITAGGIMGVNTVNIDFTGKRQSSMVFYVPLPTGTYGGFVIEFDNANSSETLASKKVSFGTNGLTVHRNEIIVAPALNALMKGAEWSYTFESKQYSANGTKTLNGKDWTLAGNGSYWGYDGTKGQQFGSGSAPYKSLTLTSNFGQNYGVKDIVINTSGASSINATVSVSVGGVALICDGATSKSLTSSATDYAFSAPNGNLLAGDIVISYSQTSSKALYLKSINVNPDSRTPLDQVTNLSATQDGNSKNVIVSWTGVEHAASYTVSVGEQSETIQPASDDQYQQTFIVPSYGNYDVTVTANPESGYKASVATTTISVIEHVSLTVFVEGTSSSVVGEVGQLISELLPDDPNCSVTGYTFTGWSTTEYAMAQTNEPTYVASTTTLPENGMTVYAVFAKQTQSQENLPVTYDQQDFSGRGSSGSGGAPFTHNEDDASIAFTGAYEAAEHVRIYNSSTVTFSSERTITKIEITCTSKATSNDYGPNNLTKNSSSDPGNYTYSSYVGTWQGSANSVTLKATAQARAKSIVITFASAPSTLSGWTTSPVAD